MVKAIKITWAIFICLCIVLIWVASKSSLFIISDKTSSAAYSLPFHVASVLTLLLIYNKWVRAVGENRIVSSFKKSVLSLLVITYIIILILFVWLFLIK